MEYTDIKVQWHYYVYWFCECQSSTTPGTDGLQMELCEGRASLNAYISSQAPHWNIQLAPLNVMEYTDIKVQWHYYVYWSVSARAGELGRMVSQMNCVGESSLMLT